MSIIIVYLTTTGASRYLKGAAKPTVVRAESGYVIIVTHG